MFVFFILFLLLWLSREESQTALDVSAALFNATSSRSHWVAGNGSKAVDNFRKWLFPPLSLPLFFSLTLSLSLSYTQSLSISVLHHRHKAIGPLRFLLTADDTAAVWQDSTISFGKIAFFFFYSSVSRVTRLFFFFFSLLWHGSFQKGKKRSRKVILKKWNSLIESHVLIWLLGRIGAETWNRKGHVRTKKSSSLTFTCRRARTHIHTRANMHSFRLEASPAWTMFPLFAEAFTGSRGRLEC